MQPIQKHKYVGNHTYFEFCEQYRECHKKMTYFWRRLSHPNHKQVGKLSKETHLRKKSNIKQTKMFMFI